MSASVHNNSWMNFSIDFRALCHNRIIGLASWTKTWQQTTGRVIAYISVGIKAKLICVSAYEWTATYNYLKTFIDFLKANKRNCSRAAQTKK